MGGGLNKSLQKEYYKQLEEMQRKLGCLSSVLGRGGVRLVL